jgi:hypothetical protein
MPAVVTIVEVDLPICTLTYGVAPCTAAIGVTGDRKCFNTVRTCQDREAFDPAPLTMRFMMPGSTPEAFDGIPILRGVSVTPQVLDPGVSIGQRETVTVTLEDTQHSDSGLDKYQDERGYDPFPRGTFWGRFRARLPSIMGSALRVKRGVVGQDPETMDTWHYVVETTKGPAGGRFTIVAKDALKLADGDRAQAPKITRGVLSAPLAAGAGSCTLSPVGIGALDYPAAGKVAIGGREIASFTRSGDVLTLTARGLHNTDDADHDDEARVQVVLEYTAEGPADILADLLLNYTDIDTSQIDLAGWQAEVNAYTPRLYTAIIAEPVAVNKLVNELVNQVGLVMWSDTRSQAIRLIGLRQVGAEALVLDTDHIVAGTFQSKEQLEKRVSQAWCYYGLLNPLESDSDPKNYAGVAVDVDDTGADEEYGSAAYRKTFSRWINMFNRQAAHRVNEILLSRLRDPPRHLTLDLYASDTPPAVGGGAWVKHWELQDDTGAPIQIPVQVISSEATDDRVTIQGEEMGSYSPDGGGTGGGGGGLPPDDTEKIVFIDVDVRDLNLRAVYDSIYAPPDYTETITFIIGSGVRVGASHMGNVSAGSRNFAIDTGLWPESPAEIILKNSGDVMGSGGRGKTHLVSIGLGANGTHALRVRVPITIENLGRIAGGGGGGGNGTSFRNQGAGGGGGGAGNAPSVPGSNTGFINSPVPTGGYYETPGTGGGSGGPRGGNGGALGAAGEDRGTDGGDPGIAVHGDDLVTWTTLGLIVGDRLDAADPIP